MTAFGRMVLAALFVIVALTSAMAAPPHFVSFLGSNAIELHSGSFIITGSNFTGVSSVNLDGIIPLTFVVSNDAMITVIFASSLPPRQFDLRIVGPDGTETATLYLYNEVVVQSVTPRSGPRSGGTPVTITGSGFIGGYGPANAVKFDGIPATSFTVDSDTQISALTPPNSTGLSDIRVATQSTPNLSFTGELINGFSYATRPPQITAITPANGPQGTPVTITGTDMGGISQVTFGGSSASFTIDSPSSVTAIAPNHLPGAVGVRVRSVDGTSDAVPEGVFTYTAGANAPVLDGMSPSFGPANTVVTITGTNLDEVTAVQFDGVSASFTPISSTSLTVLAPPHAFGSALVTLSSPDGPNTSTGGDSFLYMVGPATHFQLEVTPDPPILLEGITVKVTALDIAGNIATNYNNSVVLTSSDASALNLPQSVTLLSGQGVTTNVLFSPTFLTPGLQTLTATDQFNPALTGTVSFTMAPGQAYRFEIQGAPAGAAAGSSFPLAVKAFDFANNVATGYAGTVHFTSTDTAAVLPADTWLVNGEGTFMVTLNTPGPQTITATDLVTTALTAITASIQVTAPVLNVTMEHDNTAGTNALKRYTILPRATVASTSGMLTAQFTLPSGMTASSIVGTNWTCSTATLACTTSASIAVGNVGNPIRLDAALTNVTATSVTPSVTLSGGGATVSVTASDQTDVVQVSLNTIPTLVVGVPAQFFPVTISGGGSQPTYSFNGLSQLSYNSVTGEVSGTPTTAGVFNVVAGGSDSPVLNTMLSAKTFALSIINPPAITGLDLTSGPTAGGVSIVITGTDFAPVAGDNSVSFDGVPAVVTNASTTSLTVTTPAHAVGIVDVSVTVGPATSATSPASKFEYQDAPVLTFTTPGSASVPFDGTLTNAATSTIAVPGAGAISYVSSDPGVATVDANGAITTISAGTTTITATQAAAAGINELATATYALTVTLMIPGEPTGVVAVAGDGQATVSFVAPASNGGAAILGYLVISSPGNKTAVGMGSPLTVSGLTNGTAYTFTVQATNTLGTAPPSLPSNSVTPLGPLAIMAGAAAGAKVGVAFSQSNTASGGQGPYLYGLAAGVLPAGTSLGTSTGAVTGTPTAGGPFSYAIEATDNLGASATINPITGTITAPAIVFNTAVLPDAGEGQSYGPVSLPMPSGGTAPYAFAAGAGLPPGVNLSPLGILSGTPSADGSYNFTVSATDSSTGSGPYSASQSFDLTVLPPVPVVDNVAFSILADSGANPVPLDITGTADSVAVVSPPVHGTIAISGTDMTYTPDLGQVGTDSFTYKASNAGGDSNTATVDITIGALATTTVLTASPAPSTFGSAVSFTATVTGSTPTGLVQFFDGATSLGSRTLNGSGVATLSTAALSAVTHSIKAVYAGDGTNAGSTSNMVSQIVAKATPSVSLASSLNPAVFGQSVSLTATLSGGVSPTGSVQFFDGATAIGTVTISGGNAVLSASSLVVAPHSLTALYLGNAGNAAALSSVLSQQVNAPAITVTPSILPGAAVGSSYSGVVFGATGGSGSYDFVLAGTLPAGMTFASGALSGTPSEGGSFPLTITATDHSAPTAFTGQQGYTLVVSAASIVLPAGALTVATRSVPYAENLPAASGGTAPYLYAAIDPSALPPGITLSITGALSGTPTAVGTYHFDVEANDSSTGSGPYSAVRSFQIVVQPPAQQPPVATGDAYQTNEGITLTVAAPGLLGNDTDPDGDSLTAILVADTADGALTLNADGSFVFVPGAGFSGSTSFTYKANDGIADSNVATVSIDVDAVAPMAGPTALNVPFGSADTPVSLTVSGPVTGVGIVTPPANGTATVSGLTISYRPDATFAGPDSFTYQAVNGVLISAPATVAITVAPPAPVVLPATVLPAAAVGTAYSATIDPASGGSGSFSYQIVGVLPPWMSFDPAARQLSGSPPAVGAVDVTLRATDTSTGTGPFSGDQTYHLSVLGAQGSIAIAVETDGADGDFGFTSPTPALNLIVPTTGGSGQSAATSLPSGHYTIRADDMRQAGLALTDIACTDPGVAVNLELGQVDIDLANGQSVVCTFQSTASREHTTALIDDFIANRANLIMTNQPDSQRRIDRLNGVLPSGGNPVSALMGYLPGVIESRPLAAATSLASINQLAGNQATDPLDVWMEGTFALLGRQDSTAKSALLAVGADYLVNPDLLVGGFVQGDFMTQSSRLDAGWIEGKGWLAGPYLTAKLSDHLYLDLLAAAGRSSNDVSPYGTYTDNFGATRWLASAALQGQWDYGDFTFSPAARLSYFEETSDAYLDSLGVPIPSVTTGIGQLAIGPGASWHLQTDGQVGVDTHLKFEGIIAIANSNAGLQWQDPRGRVEAGIDLRLPGAANIGLTLGYDGIGTPDSTSVSAKVQLSAPL